MPGYLEYTQDKFTFLIAGDRFYSSEGIWAREENGRITVGISDFLQQRSGDVAFVEIVTSGAMLSNGDEIASIETIKVDFSVATPVSGTVIKTNPAMENKPEVINDDPYGKGWLAVIDATDWQKDRSRLLNPQEYYEVVKTEAETGT